MFPREIIAPKARQSGGSLAFASVARDAFRRAVWTVFWMMTAVFMAGCAPAENAAPTTAPNTLVPTIAQSIRTAAPTTAPPSSTAAPETTGVWKTYTNWKFGYEIQFPLNWFNESSDFDYQAYAIFQAPFCGGGRAGVFIEVRENPENLTADQYLRRKLESPEYSELPIQIASDRMGFAPDLDVVISEGYPGAGSPGPLADVNTGRGQIIEIYTETMGFPVEKIFSTFRLIDADPTLEEFKAEVFDAEGKSAHHGDIVIIDGSRTTRITDWGYNYSPLLSPDKTKVAYLSQTKEAVESGVGFYEAGFSSNVWVIGVDGSNPVQVTAYVPGVPRGNLHWLDGNRLLFSDGESSVKVYAMDSAQTSTVFDLAESIPDPSPEGRPFFLFNSDFSYLLWFPDLYGSAYAPIAIVDLATLSVILVADPIFPKTCHLEFGPDNTTFLGQKEPLTASDPAVLDLKTGKVAYGSSG